jgi:putative spermidine/putrescine transport system permease protein
VPRSASHFAVRRFRFFRRDTVGLVVLLPIALPGIVTGIALDAAFRTAGQRSGSARS